MYLGLWGLSGRLRAEVLADAVINLGLLIIVFLAFPLGYDASEVNFDASGRDS
jgi:hypothetical protein